MDPVAFQAGPVQVYWYPVFAALAVTAGWVVARQRLLAAGLSKTQARTMLLLTAAGALVGARATYVLAHWSRYAAEPVAALKVSEGGLVLYGGLSVGAALVVAFSLVKRLNLSVVGDAVAPALPLAVGIGRIGCFLNGCCSGTETSGPLGVVFPGAEAAVHPVQLYASLANLAVFFGLWVLSRASVPSGALFWAYLASYGSVRFVLEFMRTTADVFLGLSGAQVFSVVAVCAGAAGLALGSRRGWRVVPAETES
ncbi:MAG: prolipoprotein diacylglyceryl transferase [Coriobacteriia bacterium]